MTILDVNVDSELKENYILYSCSIFNRALPHIVDGLKTAQRRIILGMMDLGLKPSGQFKKVSRLEGHVLGLYHPQGGCAGTAINMGQCDTFRYPLTNIHGNVGGSIQVGLAMGKSISNDPPAAARYLEIKASELTQEIFINQLDKHSHEWRENYDSTTEEVVFVVPKIPTLLINGSVGIAAGYACNHLSYNLKEVCEATIAFIKDNSISFETLSKIILGPDFPHGARVVIDDLVDLLKSGSGGIDVYGSWVFKDVKYGKKTMRPAIIVNELASGSAEAFLEKVKDGVESEKITGVADISDYSSKDGINIEIVLKKDGNQSAVLAQLLQHTNLYTRVNANAVAMKGVMPQKVSTVEIISSWYEARKDCLIKKFQHTHSKNLQRLEILAGLIIISDNIDEAIKLIRASKDKAAAAKALKSRFSLSEIQTTAVLSMTLSQLVKTEKAALLAEKKQLQQHNIELNRLITNKSALDGYIINEIESINSAFGDERRTRILKSKPVAVIKAAAVRASTKKIVAASNLSLKDIIKKEAREVGITRKALNEFFASVQSSGKSIKESWKAYKTNFVEFVSPKGKRARRQELDALKLAAYNAGMPKRGKDSWTTWIAERNDVPLEQIKSELKKKLGNKLKIK